MQPSEEVKRIFMTRIFIGLELNVSSTICAALLLQMFEA